MTTNKNVLDASVKMHCGCSWHETTSWTICDECSKLECFQAPKGHKTPLELFDGNDLNLKSNSGVKQYAFNSYAIRRIRNALEKYEELNTRPQPSGDAVKALDELDAELNTAYCALPLKDYSPASYKSYKERIKTIRAALAPVDVERLKDWISEATSIFEHIIHDLRDNQDLSHKDFRIKVSEMAHDYLSHNHIRHLAAQGHIALAGGASTIPAAINVVLDDLVRADGRDESDFSHGYYTALDEAKSRIAAKLKEMGVI